MPNIYDDLCERILCAQEEMLKHEIEANTVVLNGKKYAKLMKPGYYPTIFGMALEVDRMLPDDWDFIVQRREPKIATNADRIRSMSDEQLALAIRMTANCDLCPIKNCKARHYSSPDNCERHWLQWLQSPVGGDGE